MNEEWRSVTGWEGLYEVSDQGRVRSLDRVVTRYSRANKEFPYRLKGRVLSEHATTDGYRQHTFSDGARRQQVLAHALVAEAFLGPRPSQLHVRHLRGAVAGDGLDNIAYGTITENNRDKIAHGTQRRGSLHHMARLSESDVADIRASADLQENIAAAYGVTQTLISKIKLRRIWRHV